MIGTSRSNLRQPTRILAAGKFEHVRLVIERDDDRLLPARQPTDQRHDLGRDRSALSGFERLSQLPAKHAAFRGLSTAFRFNIRLCLIDNGNGFGVTILLRLSPSHQSVLFHQHQLRIRVGQYALCDHFG
ncbi:hypothetical protein D3C74_373980 [compost metagenome]